jgi:hypothetical protein
MVMAFCAVLAGGTLTQKKPEPPVLFRIVLPCPEMCVGDRYLEVEAELRNISEHPISLSASGIRAQVSFMNLARSLQDGFRSNTISSDPIPDGRSNNVVTLTPGQSYRQPLKLELDHDFFSTGVYSVQIAYSGRYGAGRAEGLFLGTVDSNEALFEITDCESSHAKKP